jgi:CHAD domain-containing protein
MAYAINIAGDADPRGEIRRIALERIVSARKNLRKVTDGVDERIHGIRRDLKKLRALIRLLRKPLGKSRFKQEDHAFRDAGRLLAPFRDAAARVAVVEALRGKETGAISASALEAAHDEVRSLYRKTVRKDDVRKAAKGADALLEEAEKRLKDWELEESGFGLLREGLAVMYAHARTGLARCLIHPTAPNFHDWRKCCKYLRYQIELLHPVSPREMKVAEDTLHKLTDLLGNDHDLAVLGETLESLSDGTLDDAELWAIHQSFQSEHQRFMKGCWIKGRGFFTGNAGDFVKRIEGYWEAATMGRMSGIDT